MNVFELATTLTTTGEDQVAAALGRVEQQGAGAAKNITTAWSGVGFQPATASAMTLGSTATKLASNLQQTATAANVTTAATRSAATAQGTLATRLREVIGLTSRPVGDPFQGPAKGSEQLTGGVHRAQRALFGMAAASLGVPGPLGRVAESLLMLGTGGVVVAAVTAGMALIGYALKGAGDKAAAESQRITGTVQTWIDKLNELTGATRRQTLADLAKNVEDLATAFAKADLQRRRTEASYASPVDVAIRQRQAREAEKALHDARAALDQARGSPNTGLAATVQQEKYLQLLGQEAGMTTLATAAREKLTIEEGKLQTQLAASNLTTDEKIRLEGLLISVQDKLRSSYDAYIKTLQSGAGLQAGTQATAASAAARKQLGQEEQRLQAQLERTNLVLQDRVRIEGLLVQVQTTLGDLPETEERRAAVVLELQAAYDGYLGVLTTAMAFESTRPQAEREIGQSIRATTAALRDYNLTFTERLRLEQRLVVAQAAAKAGQDADRAQAHKALAEQNNAALAALAAAMPADLASIEARTTAIIIGMGPKLSAAGVTALAAVNDALMTAPVEVATTLTDALATGFTSGFAKAGDAILAGLGGIFTAMGKKLIVFGLTMLKLLPFLSNPFTSGPAAIAAGIALVGLGAALGGIASGRGGSGGGGGGVSSGPSFSQGSQERIVRIIVNPPAGQTSAQSLQPVTPVHFTIIGPADPVAQRGIAEMVNAANDRGLIRTTR